MEEHAIAGVLSKERKSLQSTVVVTVCGVHPERCGQEGTTAKPTGWTFLPRWMQLKKWRPSLVLQALGLVVLRPPSAASTLPQSVVE